MNELENRMVSGAGFYDPTRGRRDSGVLEDMGYESRVEAEFAEKGIDRILAEEEAERIRMKELQAFYAAHPEAAKEEARVLHEEGFKAWKKIRAEIEAAAHREVITCRD